MAHLKNKTGQLIIGVIKNHFFSIFALTVSFFSAYFSLKSYRDNVTQKAIENTYRTFHDMSITAMNNSDLIHLCAMPEAYNMVKADIHLSLMPINEKKRAEYNLKERAFANYIFGFYESTLLQYNESVKISNTDRTNFLEGILDFFRNKILRNPRLIYLWDINGGKMSINYTKVVIEDYDKNVLNNNDSSIKNNVDPVGPYFIDSIEVSH